MGTHLRADPPASPSLYCKPMTTPANSTPNRVSVATPATGAQSMPPRISPRRPRFVSDVLPAAVAALILGVPTLTYARDGFPSSTFLFGIQHLFGDPASSGMVSVTHVVITVIAAFGMPLALVWRASHPVFSTTTIAVIGLLHFFIGLIVLPIDLVIFASLYSITVYGPSKYSRAALIVALAGGMLVSLSAAAPRTPFFDPIVITLLLLLSATLVMLSWGAGLLRRSRLEQRESLRERAMRLERERDQQAQIATVAERNRIAREMHDVVAHSLSVIVAQADGGRYAAAADPDAAAAALETIAETSRAALADMRQILGVLREDHLGNAVTAPQPATGDLESLVNQVRSAGLDVTYSTTGQPRTLPPGAGIAVYRIVQESLTNILKHAGPNVHATVAVAWSRECLSVVIEDDGVGSLAASDNQGHGLVGMRERTQMLGGTLEAGPMEGGGFQVRIDIPLPR